MIDTKLFFDYLRARDLNFFTGVPDSLLKNLCACISGSDAKHIIAANEGNAVAMAAGYHIATGGMGVVYMQNSGEGNAVNPLLSLADKDVYSIPMLLIIGWRGQPGIKDEPQHVKQGKLTLELLETMGIHYAVLTDNYEPQIDACLAYIKQNSVPAAIVIEKGCFSPYNLQKSADNFKLKREEALEILVDAIGDDALIVSTTGKTSREIFEIREKRSEGHERDFLTVGSMGHTASIALGLSLGCECPVYCIDGDGSFLMHMGSLGVAAKNAPPSFKYVMINNGAHESVGGQPTIGLQIDAAAILKGLGFADVVTAQTKQETLKAIAWLKEAQSGALIVQVNMGSRDDLGRPTLSPKQNKEAMMAAIKSKQRRTK